MRGVRRGDPRSELSNDRLHAALRNFGWGPKKGLIRFERENHGWRLGNGVVVTPWAGTAVPSDPEQALSDIEEHNARYL